MSRLINTVKIGIRKLYLTYFRPFPIALVILIGTKNHSILETSTKIQFYHITLNLTNTKPLTNWQVLISMKLNLNKNVNSNFHFVIQFQNSSQCCLWFLYANWTIFSSQHRFSYPQILKLNHLILIIPFH